jgi:hypothetical protein
VVTVAKTMSSTYQVGALLGPENWMRAVTAPTGGVM